MSRYNPPPKVLAQESYDDDPGNFDKNPNGQFCGTCCDTCVNWIEQDADHGWCDIVGHGTPRHGTCDYHEEC